MEVVNGMKKHLVMITLLGLVFILPALAQSNCCASHTQKMKEAAAATAATPVVEYAPMAAPGGKVQIGNGAYLIYGFDKPLKMGTVIMKVEVFTADGKKDNSLEIKADMDMPSMRGAHATGDRSFQLSKKGDYLLPLSIVMPGEWEIKLSVAKDGKVIFRGKYSFNV
jgi:hypothetical protein